MTIATPVPDPAPAPTPAPEPPAPPALADPEPAELGDAGKKILADARKAQRDAESARKTAEKLATDAQAELEKVRAGQLTETEKAIEAAKAEGRTEVTTAMNARILESEIKVAAAMKLADPADAVKLIDASQFTVKPDGSVDGDIGKAIDDLIAAKPYLAAGATPGRPGPVGGGPQGDAPAVTRDGLKHMTRDQILALDPKLVEAALATPY